MMDCFELGSAPWDEECVQVITGKDYHQEMREECMRFGRAIEKKFPPPNDNAFLTIKSFAHDFGTYYEVCVRFDDRDADAVEYAYMLEDSLPGTWKELEGE